MKSNLLRTFFEWALITSVLMSVGFFAWFIVKSRAARTYVDQIGNAQALYQSHRTFVSTLLGQCELYAKTNTDMARLLASLNQPSPAPAPAASGKPGTK